MQCNYITKINFHLKLQYNNLASHSTDTGSYALAEWSLTLLITLECLL